MTKQSNRESSIAVLGVSVRFPGASTAEAFWQNLVSGVVTVRHVSEDEARAAGVSASVMADPSFVRAWGALDGHELFDPAFFGISPREATMIDPQQRLLLECCREAIERCGYDPERYPGRVGVFAGVGFSDHLWRVYDQSGETDPAGLYQLAIANEKDSAATRISYKLNLRGPSVGVQTACSTSLVAVHLACQSLLNGEADLTLAGAASVSARNEVGYFYQPGGIMSASGHCRPFDARADGTVGGFGVGVVALKRLDDALADRDTILAVIRSTAINNDGASKVGFTAPSLQGQAAVIAEALAMAEVEPSALSFVETHGTGTALGDAVEIAALTKVFGSRALNRCALGAVKANVGHLDTASGMAGLIKTVLALHHGILLPHPSFERPNPQLRLEDGPFYFPVEAQPWSTNGSTRLAAVSSFGIGGTNAHVVLEGAPQETPAPETTRPKVVILSAKSDSALGVMRRNLREHLTHAPNLTLADVEHTLQLGRPGFSHRTAIVSCTVPETIAALGDGSDRHRMSGLAADPCPVAFLFPGQGAQYPSMGAGLYATDPPFRQEVDRCCSLLASEHAAHVRRLVGAMNEGASSPAQGADDSIAAQLSLFVVEYALAQRWLSLGVSPAAMLGHSLGEYVAACLAGVFPLEAALRLIAARGRLFRDLPEGAMLAVALAEDPLREQLVPFPPLSIAAVNGPQSCVVSGPVDTVAAFERDVRRQGVASRRLPVTRAFHSAMLDPVLGELRRIIGEGEPRPPDRPYVSCVTGTWVNSQEAASADFWVRHSRDTVRFSDAATRLLGVPGAVLLEIGPGSDLGSFVRRQSVASPRRQVVASMRPARSTTDDLDVFVRAAGALWCAGVPIDWTRLNDVTRHRRVPLPTYPFERRTCALDQETSIRSIQPGRREICDWFYVPSWTRHDDSGQQVQADAPQLFVVIPDAAGIGRQVAERLTAARVPTTVVSLPDTPAGTDDGVASPTLASVRRILRAVMERHGVTRTAVVVDCRALDEKPRLAVTNVGPYETAIDHAVGVVTLAGALKGCELERTEIVVLTAGAQDVVGSERLRLHERLIHGPGLVVPQEYSGMACRTIDLDPDTTSTQWGETVDAVVRAILSDESSGPIACRGPYAWEQILRPWAKRTDAHPASLLRAGGVYLITGGLGRIGLALAESLIRTQGVKVAVLTRQPLPEADGRAALLNRLTREDSLLVVHGDIAMAADLRRARALIEQRWGALHGVIHAAGITSDDGFRGLQNLNARDFEQQGRAKVLGADVLVEVFQRDGLDFVLLVSSLAALLGGIGFAAYAGVNAYLDGVAQRHDRKWNGTRWISVNLDGWHETPVRAGAAAGMTPAQGLEVFRYALSLNAPTQLVVSTVDVEQRRLAARDLMTAPAGATREPPLMTDTSVEATDLGAAESVLGQIEARVDAVWRDILGCEVGPFDEFLDLGGNSLLAIQVLSRLRVAFAIDLPVDLMFRESTVRKLSVAIRDLLIVEVEREDKALQQERSGP